MKSARSMFLVSAVAMGLIGCAADIEESEDFELSAERQELVDSTNGLTTINGLTTLNGLMSVNGLTTLNGLKTVNGLTTLNGLSTLNGLTTLNGLSVDCAGKTLGVDCTGAPDGLLSASKGLMASDQGVMTAKYMMRCALPAGDSIRIKDYTGGLVSLPGEMGLAPSWKSGQCDSGCQERVSACLMAFTNGSGNHVQIEMSATNMSIGGGHNYPYQEAAFYGNVFTSPPKAFFCVGSNFASLLGQLGVLAPAQRACTGYNALLGNSGCPYVQVGACNFALGWTAVNKCSFSNSSATSCKDNTGSLLTAAKTWSNPITTYRLSTSQ